AFGELTKYLRSPPWKLNSPVISRFAVNRAAAVATHTAPIATPLANLRRHHSHSTIGPIRSAWLGFEYVAMPRRTAAMTSVERRMRKRGGDAPARSLYSQKKYAANTSAK